MIWRSLAVMAVIVPLLGIPSIPASASGVEDTADLILRHGRFYPVVPEAPIDGSLAVRDGRIVYLGDDAGAEALRGPATRIVELDGRTVTPGLIDAHSHLLSLGAALGQVDLVGTGSYAEVIARVAAAAAAVVLLVVGGGGITIETFITNLLALSQPVVVSVSEAQ